MTVDSTVPELPNHQLRDVGDTLRQPLSGRKVLLPFGRQAFVEAKLAPTLDDATEELVQIRLADGSLREMTRMDARTLLDDEYRESSKPKRKPPSALKKAATPTSVNSSTSSSASSPTSAAASSPAQFFDIREEIDALGNPIGGEAIDITEKLKQMETLAANQSSMSAPSSSRNIVDQDNDVDDGAEEDAVSTIEDPTPSLRKLDDDEYETLASRLEELARLEETAELETVANQSSRTKLAGKAWSKGFLNKKKVSKIGASISANNTNEETTSETQATRKAVAFADFGPNVKEIPRIGERSIKQEQAALNRFKKPTGWSKGFLNSKSTSAVAVSAEGGRRVAFDEEVTVQEIPSVRDGPTARHDGPIIKSFDELVLSSVVMEHVVTEKQPQEPPEEPVKKLSKFAQRRLDAMQQH